MKLNRTVRASLQGDHPASLRAIPLLFATVLISYIVMAFFLMEIVKADIDSPTVSTLLKKFHIDDAHIVFFRYSIIGCIVVPFVLLIEWACVGWTRSSIKSMITNKKLSGRSDFICFLLTHLRLLRLPQILFTLGFALISGSMVSDAVGHRLFPGFSGFHIPIYILYPFYFFLYTFFDYIAHRVDHSRYFWPLHRFHHAAEDFNVFTADRGHPASAFTQGGLKIFPLAMLGVPPDAIIDIGMLIVVINYVNHSRIDWDFGWFGRWIIQSPLHHQLHHSRGLRHPTNLSICPLWDRLGGSWQDVKSSSIIIGTSVPYRHGAFVVPDMLRDYRDFLKGVWRGMREFTAAISARVSRRYAGTSSPDTPASPPPDAPSTVEAGAATAGG